MHTLPPPPLHLLQQTTAGSSHTPDGASASHRGGPCCGCAAHLVRKQLQLQARRHVTRQLVQVATAGGGGPQRPLVQLAQHAQQHVRGQLREAGARGAGDAGRPWTSSAAGADAQSWSTHAQGLVGSNAAGPCKAGTRLRAPPHRPAVAPCTCPTPPETQADTGRPTCESGQGWAASAGSIAGGSARPAFTRTARRQETRLQGRWQAGGGGWAGCRQTIPDTPAGSRTKGGQHRAAEPQATWPQVWHNPHNEHPPCGGRQATRAHLNGSAPSSGGFSPRSSPCRRCRYDVGAAPPPSASASTGGCPELSRLPRGGSGAGSSAGGARCANSCAAASPPCQRSGGCHTVLGRTTASRTVATSSSSAVTWPRTAPPFRCTCGEQRGAAVGGGGSGDTCKATGYLCMHALQLHTACASVAKGLATLSAA